MILTYTKTGPDNTESVTVHVTESGHVKMTAVNLDGLLRHLGFVPTNEKADA